MELHLSCTNPSMCEHHYNLAETRSWNVWPISTREVNSSVAKPPLKFNGDLAKHGLTWPLLFSEVIFFPVARGTSHCQTTDQDQRGGVGVGVAGWRVRGGVGVMGGGGGLGDWPKSSRLLQVPWRQIGVRLSTTTMMILPWIRLKNTIVVHSIRDMSPYISLIVCNIQMYITAINPKQHSRAF